MTRPSAWTLPAPSLTTSAPTHSGISATWMRRWRATIRPSSASPITPLHTAIAASYYTGLAHWTSLCRVSTRRSGSKPMTPSRITIGHWYCRTGTAGKRRWPVTTALLRSTRNSPTPNTIDPWPRCSWGTSRAAGLASSGAGKTRNVCPSARSDISRSRFGSDKSRLPASVCCSTKKVAWAIPCNFAAMQSWRLPAGRA